MKDSISISVASLIYNAISRRVFLKYTIAVAGGSLVVLKFSEVFGLGMQNQSNYPDSVCCYSNCYNECHDDGCNIHADGW
jgi:anaerobic selenocysteine-containing dehydrogenase